MEHRPHPEQGYRACLGLQRLCALSTRAERLEAACTRAMAIRTHLPQRGFHPGRRAGSTAATVAARPDAQAPLPLHENVRGPDYYH
jgi:hypothetical protein